ncbi:alpha/beta fold hydrolase [Streptomyces sp. NPDC059255]|uniref:alpha/beta fold hydrolase n=1 Tax=Streptomyces sp. NPDC059255 TaxID=3346793 RepID=UPI0036BA640A
MDPTAAVAGTVLNTLSRVSGRLAGAGAFTLFRLPLARGKARPADRRLMETATTGQVEINGKTAVTYRWGTGERPVLCVHGWQSRGSRFADFVPGLLDRGYSVITFDTPGHGEATGRSTTIVEYRAIISELHREYGDFEAVVAHSLGVLATFLTLRTQVRTGRIAALSGVPDFDYLVDEFCAQLGLRAPLKAALRGRIERDLFPGEPDIWTRFSVLDRPEDIQVPILLLHDEADEMVGVAHARRVADAYGDRARLTVTEGLGHRRILGDPGVVRTILDFVDEGRREEAPGTAPAAGEQSQETIR